MAKLPKIIVESYNYNNYRFSCECYDAQFGDNTPNRIVTENELTKHLNASSLSCIPIVTTYESATGEEVEHERIIGFEEWCEMNTIEYVLAEIINAREGRTGRPGFRELVILEPIKLPFGEEIMAVLRSICEPSKSA